MNPDAAAWVRAHAWTSAMRREARDLAWIVTCACQSGPTWHCTHGRHDQCHRATGLHQWEAVICDRTGIYPVYHAAPHQHSTPSLTGPRREHVAQVYLADRICRWICPCTCHTGASTPAMSARTVLRSRLAARPASRPPAAEQLDLLTLT